MPRSQEIFLADETETKSADLLRDLEVIGTWRPAASSVWSAMFYNWLPECLRIM